MGRNDDRSEPMARAGRVTHLVARSGWLAGGTLGMVVMVLLSAVVAAPDPVSTADAFFTWLLVLVPAGAVLGASGGLLAQSAARQRLSGPAAASRRAAVGRAADHGLRRHGRWARFYEACARSVARYHDVVATLADGPGRDWLAGIGTTLDAELAEALRLARLGESLEPDELTAPGETVYQVLNRLRTAKTSFAETTERAAAIALELRDQSDFVQVRAQLDMLAEQAPRLRHRGV